MIGATTTFYEHTPHAADLDRDIEYDSYLQNFPQPGQFLNNFVQTPDYPQYQSQGLLQNSYLPTPSVSPTSTSAVAAVAAAQQHASPTTYYALNGAIDQHQPPPPRYEAINTSPQTNPKKDRQQPARRKAPAKSKTAAAADNATGPRKRPRPTVENTNRVSLDADDSDDDEGDDKVQTTQRLYVAAWPSALLHLIAFLFNRPGACRYCKKLKMRCEFPTDSSTTCKRCQSGNHECVVEGRKPRSGPNKREYLLAQLRQKEAIIDSLLRQINNPLHHTPLNLALPPNSHHPSPEPTVNKDVQAWIEKIQGSVRTAGGGGGKNAFTLDKRAEGEDTFDEDEDEDGGAVDENEGDEEADEPVDKEAAPVRKGKLHCLPEEAAPLGLIANLSIRGANSAPRKQSVESRGGEGDAENENDVGVASATYFLPGPATNLDLRRVIVERTMPPEILMHGLVTPDDVEELFKIFYERINPFISILDPTIHTPERTFGRCPFLFTVVCAIASRYYAPKATIYKYAMHFAKTAAASSLIDGWKSVELCQAYLLMSVYSVPARRWEEDRSWLYLGLAIRIATDLNLHQPGSSKPPTSEKQEREHLNRTRTWLICFNLDRSMSTQLGKPSTIKEDPIIRNSSDWYRRSAFNHPYDVHLCAYTELLRLVTRFHEDVWGNSTGIIQVDFYDITMRYDQQLREFQEQATVRFDRDSKKDDAGSVFRTGLLPFICNYSRLVMFSFGFQHAVQRGLKRDDPFFKCCYEAACAVITTVVERLAPTGYTRYAPDGHFVFTSFAAAFLLKLLRPDFAGIVNRSHKDHILSLVRRLIRLLGSPEIAVDDRHTPKLYSRFLSGLVARYSTRKPKGEAGSKVPEGTAPKQNRNNNPAPDPNAGSNVQQNVTQTSPAHLLNVSDAQYQNQYGHQQVSMSPEAYSSPSSINNYQFDEPMPLPEVVPEDFLASMQAINNPGWWENVMMPGFTWPAVDQNQMVAPPTDENGMTGVTDTGLALSINGHNAAQQLQQQDFSFMPHEPQPMMHQHQRQRQHQHQR
ncbi:fungal-specific transcription factor domain-containing protein [Hysterangium stoloniferum]|nr:fungal-specific transcription factor domain-containing protein [Hysterangium stoloniferum]